MTITFVPKANIKEVEVEGYGVVKVRPYGAGEELQLSKSFRELDGLQKKAEQLLADAKEKYGEDDTNLPDSYKTELEAIQKDVSALSDELNALIKGTISSDDPAVVEKLFRELPMSEIRRLISEALGAKNAEA